MTLSTGRLIACFSQFLALLIVGFPAEAQDTSKNRFYRGLNTGIEFYSQIAASGGWPQVADGPTLKIGMRDPRVSTLRERLSITGDYIGTETNSRRFDEELEEAVIGFQNRNGQEPDGSVGKATLAALNIPVEARIRQMEINLERWNRMPSSLGQTFVLVNMAGFELDVIEGEKTVLEMRVVVGKGYHSTPMFSDIIKTIELNPYWNVPASIANKELLPAYIKDTATADAQGFEVVRDGAATPVSSVNWSDYEGKTLPFLIRQRPGPTNALGEMKFLFPNQHNVYLHDTNARGLFAKTVRAFSHGCVRIQKPHELAAYLLAANGDWPLDRIRQIVDSGELTKIVLKQPMPVHLAYMTAWMDRRGIVQFRPDIYGRDAELAKKL